MTVSEISRSRVVAVVVLYRPGVIAHQVLRQVESLGVRAVVWDNTPDEEAYPLEVPGGFQRLGSGVNLGFGAANNLALKAISDEAEFDWILLVNPDCLLPSATLDALLETISSDPAIAVVAPRMAYPDGSAGVAGGLFPSVPREILAALSRRLRLGRPLVAWGRRLVSKFAGRGRDPAETQAGSLVPGEPVDIDWVSGFCMLIRRTAFDSVEGFDPGYFLYFEDVDLCHRLRHRGFRVLLDRRVAAEHYESSSTSGAGKWKHYAKGRNRYFTRFGPRWARWALGRLPDSRGAEPNASANGAGRSGDGL